MTLLRINAGLSRFKALSTSLNGEDIFFFAKGNFNTKEIFLLNLYVHILIIKKFLFLRSYACFKHLEQEKINELVLSLLPGILKPF